MIDFVEDKNTQMFLLLLNEKDYDSKLFDILKKTTDKNHKICYVLLNNIYNNTKENFRKNGLSLDKFHFIDVLSTHYKKHRVVANCTFLSSTDIQEILTALKNAIEKHKCNMILFDSIADLLFHCQSFDIQKLTHTLKSEDTYTNTKKLYLMLKEPELVKEESERLLQDLRLFADHIIDLNNKFHN